MKAQRGDAEGAAAPLLFLGYKGWLSVCIPCSALQGLPMKVTRHAGCPRTYLGYTAIIASFLIEFPFSPSQKNFILDDKLNGHST